MSYSAHTPYFENLQSELKQHGPGHPVMVLDLDILDKNIAHSATYFEDKGYRLVVKSLPCTPMLKYISDKLNTNRYMVFHRPFLNIIINEFPDADILLGKPFPTRALGEFFNELPTSANAQTECDKIQWLIDTHTRCEQYLEQAKARNLKFKISLEIDIGLHRGGFPTPTDMRDTLNLIQQNPEHLEFCGFMGYEAHIASTPLGTKNRIENVRKQCMARYQAFKHFVKTNFNDLYNNDLTFNSAGTQTYQLYKGDTTINDMCSSSGLVRPTDFDLSTHTGIDPALFIATPVIKKLKGTTIPFMEAFAPLLSKLLPSWRSSVFIYGGYWKSKPESPKGLKTNGIYGRSSNQEIMTLPNHGTLEADDYVFLRPTQSESVILQFMDILLVRNGKLCGKWTPFTAPKQINTLTD